MIGPMLALLSDLHANLPALRACLAHARAAGATRIALLGDLVGYGAQPAEVVEEVMALAAQGAVVLRGNHDAAALTPPQRIVSLQDQSSSWTHSRLAAEHRAFLAALPLRAAQDGNLLVHASADEPEAWTYVDHPVLAGRSLAAARAQSPATQRVFCGHVHHQRLFYQGQGRGLIAFEPTAGAAIPVRAHRGWVATVGSVGQPRDGDPRAMYALFDAGQQRLRFERVAYDHHAAAAAVRRAGLPPDFADRLEQGR